MRQAHHIIAISPFLQNMGRALFGDKVSCLPLGIESGIFHARERHVEEVFTVVGAGNLGPWKRPEVFLELARLHPAANFIWCGAGVLLEELRAQAKAAKLENLLFAGSVAPADLAALLRKAHLFVLPSLGEGAPKVIQEAAACGVAVVAFGFYESPALRHGENGLTVWTDRELAEAVAALVRDPQQALAMGARGAEMAADWSWDTIAPLWESHLLDYVSSAAAK
jgi:glycosyltransferase involved in cell wall biosynthesis